jgi:hypothetical protein
MSGINNGNGGFKKSLVKLKNPRNSAGQAPLAPLVRACPDPPRRIGRESPKLNFKQIIAN